MSFGWAQSPLNFRLWRLQSATGNKSQDGKTLGIEVPARRFSCRAREKKDEVIELDKFCSA